MQAEKEEGAPPDEEHAAVVAVEGVTPTGNEPPQPVAATGIDEWLMLALGASAVPIAEATTSGESDRALAAAVVPELEGSVENAIAGVRRGIGEQPLDAMAPTRPETPVPGSAVAGAGVAPVQATAEKSAPAEFPAPETSVAPSIDGEAGLVAEARGRALPQPVAEDRSESAPGFDRPTAAGVRPSEGLEADAGEARREGGDRNPDAPELPSLELARPNEPKPAAAAVTSEQAPSGTTLGAPAPVDLAPRSEESSGLVRADAISMANPQRGLPSVQVDTAGRPLPASAPEAISIQAEWLATRGGGTARLLLNPPELGEIAIRVTVRNQSVDVVMVAQTAAAQSIAEEQGDRLAQAFAGRELRLDQFEVRRGEPTDPSSTGQFGSSDAGARERERAQDERAQAAGSGERTGSRRPAGSEGVTGGPRVVSTPRASGIDLRI